MDDLEKRVTRLEIEQHKRRHLINPDLGWFLVGMVFLLILYLFAV